MNQVIESILQSEDLPTPPGVALRLLELYDNSEVEISEMADVIGADPSLSAKLINYCNSPMLARQQPTTSIQQAIVVIGMRAVKILALSFSLVQTAPSNRRGFDYDAFWARSLALAVVSKTFAKLGKSSGDEEFLVGLMLGIGQVGLAHTFPADYSKLVTESLETGASLIELERREWSIDHYQISAELMQHWSFPDELVQQVQAVAETDFEKLRRDAAERDFESQQLKTLALARQVVEMLFEPDLAAEEVEKTQAMAENWFGIKTDQFAEVFDNATQTWTEFAKLLSYEAAEAQTFEQLERRALKGIARLSMGLHAENAAIQAQNAQLKINATIDSLTGLKNRRAFDEIATGEWERSKRMQRPLALMMIDIDHFKIVNDTHGHAVGDRALVAVANALKQHVRQYDLIFRLGGEEFVVLLPECDSQSASVAANRYREAIEKMEIPIEGGILKITASFGVAISRPSQASSLDALLEEADELLYQAKNEGRNRVCVQPSQPTQTMPILPSHNPTVSQNAPADRG
jgi:two-component system cell cycle response regulator